MQRQLAGEAQVVHQLARCLAGQTADETGADLPAALGQVTDVFDAFAQRRRSFQFFIAHRVGGFELHDVNARPGGAEFSVSFRRERTKADTDAEGRLAAQRVQERQHHFAHGHRVFARLDIDIGHAGRTMREEQFGELFVPGAVAMERAIVAAHAAVGAVLATEIGNLHDRADENFAAKLFLRDGLGAFVQRRLLSAVQGQVGLGGNVMSCVKHWSIKMPPSRLRNAFSGRPEEVAAFRRCLTEVARL